MVEGEPLPQVRWEMGDGRPLHDNVHVSKAAVTLREMFLFFSLGAILLCLIHQVSFRLFQLSIFYERFLILLLSLR